MKLTKIFGLGAVALAMSASAGPASATTLEVNGVTQGGSVTVVASLKSGTSTLFTDTAGSQPPLNTCASSTIQTSTSVLTGGSVSGSLKIGTFEKCTQGAIVVDTLGVLSIESVAGTTNGTVRSIGTKATWSTAVGPLTCLTSPTVGTDIGRLTGVASGSATLDISAVLNCGAVDAVWQGTYTITSPTGLGVTS
jgi:hypothetical protein